MKRNYQYVIPFKGLKNELHHFDFKVNDEFFESFENSEIQRGELNVLVSLNKKSHILEFDFVIKGKVHLICDRCLDEFEMNIDNQSILFVKFGPVSYDETDELYVLAEHESEIDLSQFIYEYIHLSLPYKRVHPMDKKGRPTCNKEMLKYLETFSIDEEKFEDDPRWNDLRNIINNN